MKLLCPSWLKPTGSEAGTHPLFPNDPAVDSDHKPRPQATAARCICLSPGGWLPRSAGTSEAASRASEKWSAVGNSWREEGQQANIRIWEIWLRPNKVHCCFPRKQDLVEPPQRTGQGAQELKAGSSRPGMLSHPTVTGAIAVPLWVEDRLSIKGERWTGSQSKTKLQRQRAR